MKRREEVLRAGALAMRRRGVSNWRLEDLAEMLGVAYTALYHYFDSRDHLVEAVLLRGLDQRRRCLAEALGESKLDRLLDFVTRYLVEDRDHKVRFPFVGGLDDPHRKHILSARERLLDDLVKLLQAGMEEGSIRSGHALTVAHVLTSYLDHFVDFDPWQETEVRALGATGVVQAIVGILRGGISSGGAEAEPSWRMSATEELAGVSYGLAEEFDRYELAMRAATAAFNARGAAASLPRIAAGLGVSKTVLYQYATDKQDLLTQCYLRSIRVVETSHRLAADFGRSPLDEALIHRTNLYRFHGSPAGPFALINALSSLRPQQQRIVAVRSAGIRATSERRLERAQAAGQIVPTLNPRIVQAVVAQTLYGLPAWYHADYPISLDQIVRETGRMLFFGLGGSR